jgi:hypothetical protein
MKPFIAIMATIILSTIGSAETYQLGSHEINFNLSVPVNCTQDVPIYYSNFVGWQYLLNITPSTGGFLAVSVVELAAQQPDSIIQTIAENKIQGTKNFGLGGYKFEIITYRERDAFEEYFPAQKVYKDGQFSSPGPDVYRLNYMLDPQTLVMVSSHGAGAGLYHEILDSMNITMRHGIGT